VNVTQLLLLLLDLVWEVNDAHDIRLLESGELTEALSHGRLSTLQHKLRSLRLNPWSIALNVILSVLVIHLSTSKQEQLYSTTAGNDSLNSILGQPKVWPDGFT